MQKQNCLPDMDWHNHRFKFWWWLVNGFGSGGVGSNSPILHRLTSSLKHLGYHRDQCYHQNQNSKNSVSTLFWDCAL